ncbi:hypothetical protein NXS19_006590 [Fusarium pseudograminearum]|nr:hypothetical protein NXS19_006590 [Fusarium pseudograminearum]
MSRSSMSPGEENTTTGNPTTTSISTRGRRRSHHACLTCRRKKTRCPGEKPQCSSCVRLKQSCSYPPAIRPSQSGPSEERLAHLEEKLDFLLNGNLYVFTYLCSLPLLPILQWLMPCNLQVYITKTTANQPQPASTPTPTSTITTRIPSRNNRHLGKVILWPPKHARTKLSHESSLGQVRMRKLVAATQRIRHRCWRYAIL